MSNTTSAPDLSSKPQTQACFAMDRLALLAYRAIALVGLVLGGYLLLNHAVLMVQFYNRPPDSLMRTPFLSWAGAYPLSTHLVPFVVPVACAIASRLHPGPKALFPLKITFWLWLAWTTSHMFAPHLMIVQEEW